MIKLLIFDWDDVFIMGAKKGYFACYHKAINEVGVFLDPQEEEKRILAKWSKPYREELKELLKEHLELLDKACAVYEREYWGGTFTKELSLLEGVNDLLVRLKEKYMLAVATGKQPKMLKEREIPYFKIPDVFSYIISSHDIRDVEKMKPHPYALELIMENLKVNPEETVFVGDAATDVQMAYAGHVTPIVVLTGHLKREQAIGLGVQYIINDVTQIEEVLKKLSGN